MARICCENSTMARATLPSHRFRSFLLLAGIVSAVVLLLNRHALLVADTFPEIARLPLVRRLFG